MRFVITGTDEEIKQYILPVFDPLQNVKHNMILEGTTEMNFLLAGVSVSPKLNLNRKGFPSLPIFNRIYNFEHIMIIIYKTKYALHIMRNDEDD